MIEEIDLEEIPKKRGIHCKVCGNWVDIDGDGEYICGHPSYNFSGYVEARCKAWYKVKKGKVILKGFL